MAILQFTVWDSAKEVGHGPVLNEGAVTLDGSARNTEIMYASYDPKRTVRVRIRCEGDDGCVAWGAASGLSVANDGFCPTVGYTDT